MQRGDLTPTRYGPKVYAGRAVVYARSPKTRHDGLQYCHDHDLLVISIASRAEDALKLITEHRADVLVVGFPEKIYDLVPYVRVAVPRKRRRKRLLTE